MLLILVYGFLEISKFNPIRSMLIDIQNTVQFNVRSDSSVEGFFDVSWCKEGYHVPEFGLLINGSKGKIIVDDDVIKIGVSFWAINPVA